MKFNSSNSLVQCTHERREREKKNLNNVLVFFCYNMSSLSPLAYLLLITFTWLILVFFLSSSLLMMLFVTYSIKIFLGLWSVKDSIHNVCITNSIHKIHIVNENLRPLLLLRYSTLNNDIKNLPWTVTLALDQVDPREKESGSLENYF